MLSLPALKEDGKQLNTIKNANNDRASSGNRQVYDYFSIKILLYIMRHKLYMKMSYLLLQQQKN